MKSFFVNGGLAAILAMSAVACGSKNSADDGKVRITATANMESEQLAQAGEQLMSPYTFMLADKVFEMSLAKDPNNQRAKFYRAFLKPLMAFQGFYKRARPFAATYGNIAQYDGGMQNVPYSPMRDFVSNGNEDIRTSTDAQNFIDQYTDALAQLYQFLKDNQDTPLTLNLNISLFEHEITASAADYCTVIQNDRNDVQVVCDYRTMLQRKVSSADMIAIRQFVAGALLYNIIYNSYSLEGAESWIMGEAGQTGAQQTAYLDSIPTFGLLRPSNKFAMVRSLGSDASAAWHFVRQHQGDLCPSQQYPYQKRRKGALLDDGICLGGVDNEGEKQIALFDMALQGPINLDYSSPDLHNARHYNVRMDPFYMTDHPVVNIKTLFAASYDACGNPTTFRDPSFGGLLPNRDANTIAAIGETCRKH